MAKGEEEHDVRSTYVCRLISRGTTTWRSFRTMVAPFFYWHGGNCRYRRSRHPKTQIRRNLYCLRIISYPLCILPIPHRSQLTPAFPPPLVVLDSILADLTSQAVQATTRRNLIKIKGLSETKVDKIKEAATKLFVHIPHSWSPLVSGS
jgi:hypothetical protein